MPAIKDTYSHEVQHLITLITCSVSLLFLASLMSQSISFKNFRHLVWWLNNKESAYQCRDTGDMSCIPELGRSPGGGNGNPLQCSSLGNPMDRGAWWPAVHSVAKVAHNLATKQQ